MAQTITATPEQVEAAAAKWCGQKDRETFPEDMEYFRQNCLYLPGLRKFVDAEINNHE